MKLYIILIAFCIITLCKSQDCKCGPGFIPKTDQDGKTQCHGLLRKIVVPCDMPEEEPCKCTEASGIVYDDEGRWCVKYTHGEEQKKWACESE